MFLLAGALIAGCASQPPAFTLATSGAFDHSVEVKRYNIGDPLWVGPPEPDKATYPKTKWSGQWGNGTEHEWTVEARGASAEKAQKIRDAYATATDDDDAGRRLDEYGSYMFARFGRRDFRWGKAVFYLTQFSGDTSMYVPHNGHLTYEVWGVTRGGEVVYATFELTHPKLGTWGPEVRTVDSIDALKKDHYYRLVETCPPDAFKPGLAEIDAFLDSLEVK